MTTTEPRWRNHAACADTDPSVFFPDLEGPDNHGRQAKAICATCPVRTDCLTEAVATREKFGIRGGTGEDERRQLRRAYTLDGPTGPVWTLARDRHFAVLDGAKLPPVNRNGPNATCGRAVTYARACRCPACGLAASIRVAGTAVDQLPTGRKRGGRAA